MDLDAKSWNNSSKCNRSLEYQKFLFMFTKADLLRLYFYTYDWYQVRHGTSQMVLDL